MCIIVVFAIGAMLSATRCSDCIEGASQVSVAIRNDWGMMKTYPAFSALNLTVIFPLVPLAPHDDFTMPGFCPHKQS